MVSRRGGEGMDGWMGGENELAFRSFWAVKTLVFVS